MLAKPTGTSEMKLVSQKCERESKREKGKEEDENKKKRNKKKKRKRRKGNVLQFGSVFHRGCCCLDHVQL